MMTANMPNLATVVVLALVWEQISNTVGSTASQNEIRVTLLMAERLSVEQRSNCAKLTGPRSTGRCAH